MMVIPAIDLMDGRIVRLYRGDPEQRTVYPGDPVSVAKRWQDDGADMLHIVDLDATIGRGSNADLVEKIARAVSVPVQAAGGLRNSDALDRAASFASRIVVGTLAFADRQLLRRLAQKYGHSRIVISVDHADGLVVTHGWQKGTGIQLLDAMGEFAAMGFTEFLLTNVRRDGTMEGPDLEFLEQACRVQNANVIASGGISGMEDVRKVRTKNASAVILGRALYENKISIAEARSC